MVRPEAEELFRRYRGLETLEDQPPIKCMEILAILVDVGEVTGDLDAVRRALTMAGEIRETLPAEHRVQFNYTVGNAQVALANAERSESAEAAWSWVSESRAESIRHYRLAVRDEAWEKTHNELQCRVLTNLANGLSHLGRIVEALPWWNRALDIQPHGMALGNRGKGLVEYGRALYSNEEKHFFVAFGCRDLRAALDQNYLEPDAKRYFTALAASIEEQLDVPRILAHADDHAKDLGSTDEERDYRRWCLGKRLFLNPLNDLAAHPMAAEDSLLLPTFVTRDPTKGTALISMFNQLKQEYVTARWLLYAGTRRRDPHFSDRNVAMLNPLDYPVYGLTGERVRLAFRSAYSILDKVAFFLNVYLDLGVPPKRVWFQRIWYKRKKHQLRPEFATRPNWPMRGLFWLSRDLYDSDLKMTTEPDARELDEIRHTLEHRFLKLQDSIGAGIDDAESPIRDDVSMKMGTQDFERKARRLLRMARSALIYLALAMHQEEVRKSEGDPRPTLPMLNDVWEDEWKTWRQ